MTKYWLVYLEYVDSEGEIQFVDDPELLPAAAGSLGLLGVVTAITYKVNVAAFGNYIILLLIHKVSLLYT